MMRIWLLMIAAAALSAQGAAAAAKPVDGQGAASIDWPATPQADAGSRDRIVKALERRYNAKVVRVVDVTVDGRPAYDIRLLSNDRVWTVRVDAATGQELPRDN